MSWNNSETLRKYYHYFVLVWLAYRFWGNTLFSQLGETVIQCPDVDNTFWAFHLLGIPNLMTHNSFVAALADVGFFLLPLLLLKFYNRWMSVILTLLLTTYYITFSTYSCHHLHSFVALIFVSIIFWSKTAVRRTFLTGAIRYYFLFSMVSAAVWKIARGSVIDVNHLATILKYQHAQWIADYPNSIFATFYQFLIQSPSLSHVLFLSAVLLELIFVVGFFTKKQDFFLALLFIVFMAFNYLVMGIFSFELLPFLLVLDILPKSENTNV